MLMLKARRKKGERTWDNGLRLLSLLHFVDAVIRDVREVDDTIVRYSRCTAVL